MMMMMMMMMMIVMMMVMILRSGLGVVVVMLSSSLELTDNTTCQLLHSSPNIQFYGVNLTNLAVNTSLGRTTHQPLLSKLEIFQKLWFQVQKG